MSLIEIHTEQQMDVLPPLSNDNFAKEVFPAIVRLAVEIGEKKVTLDENCPVLAVLAAAIGIHPETAEEHSRARQDQAIHLARLLRRALERADEQFQLDGDPALAFSYGYLAGELSPFPLFSSDEAQAAEAAAEHVILAGLSVSPAEAFRSGFTSRRDELRQAHRAD
ncbi:MAG: hypothetical protein DPW12_14710 [Rhodocyclaceae bacterium]|nr:hypothetical protein [Bacteroidia bacterium]MCQ3925399.1 hypothetical protein [Rhodocyclaceae bacterium]HNQ57794.1 hypothetical protein [Candidatus Desulfobacillus denitrificans]